MYCPKCGEQNVDDSRYCKSCGAALLQQTTTDQPTPVAQATPVIQQVVQANRTSGLSVAALVLGIIGLFLSFLGILAIIFGAIGISQTGKDPNLGGRGMAIAGLVLGIIDIGIWILALIFWSATFSYFWY